MPYRLWVEGKNDQHVIWNLAERLQLKETFEVRTAGSYSELIEILPTELKSTNILNRLGIIVDADERQDAHWQTIRNILDGSGFYKQNLPQCLPSDGLICNPDNPEQLIIGVWIMPDNCRTGMLEDFIADMIPQQHENLLLQKVDSTLDELESNQLNAYKLVHHAKARIHTWLAWQDEPGMPIGSAITQRILSTNTDLCKLFVNWLENLFDCKI